MVTPARFLFNTGLTPKDWNEKMLNDKHFKIIDYIDKSNKVFPNTEIKGGIAIAYIDENSEFEPIKEFVPDPILRRIAKRFFGLSENLSKIMFAGRSALKFNDLFLKTYPDVPSILLSRIRRKHKNVKKLSPNEEYEIKSSTFDTLPQIFYNEKPSNENSVFEIIGLEGGKRKIKWIQKDFLTPRYPDNNNIDYYKVFLPESNGNGTFGEPLSSPFVGIPATSSTPTFQSIGKFGSYEEANNLLKYLNSKFLRTLLGIRKKTQHNPPSVWELIPLQDFTNNSDIDWSKPISEIDQQLYKKYNLSPEEIDFIETHVKEME